MTFKRLAEYWQRIEATASRLEMTRILAELFKEADKQEIDKIVYLSLGSLRPKFEGIEFNLGEKMILRAIGVAYKTDLATVTKAYKQAGNLGAVIAALAKKTLENKLTVGQVYQRLWEIAEESGQGSQERKVKKMAGLIQDLDKLSAQYVVRIPVNNLRLGFSDMTVLDGLSWTAKADKSLRPELEKAFNVNADIGLISREFKAQGLKGISKVKAQAGVPIRPAKAERLASAEKIVAKLKKFAVEGKWDGLRVQLHFSPDAVKIFSRNLDNTTQMFPDVVAAAKKLPVKSLILDGEAVAYNPQTGKLLPFQETVQRKRKHGVSQKAAEMPLQVFVYDLLLLNGESFLEKPFSQRRQALEKVFSPVKSKTLKLAEQDIVTNVQQLRKLITKYLKLGLEGVMCKKLAEPYQAGARNFNWVKLKKATEGELVDTIDCVVMGYYAGKGKRTGFGIGAFLVGVPDEKGRVGTIAKIGTGLTDEQWKELKRRSAAHEVEDKPKEYLVNKNLYPDFWVRPEMVVEILADEITKSPIHAFSLALRFPRLISFRDDKSVSEATTKQELERLFKMQPR